MENGNGTFQTPPGPLGSVSPCSAGQLLGAARILSLAVQETVESKLQAELAGDRLSRSQWKLLEIFATTEVGNVTEVAAYQGVSTAAASKAVDRLVRLNLLERAEDHEDRRHICLSLSEEGRALSAEYGRRMHQRLAELFGTIPPEGLLQLAKELDHLSVEVLRGAGSAAQVCVQCGSHEHDGCLMEDSLNRTCQFHSVHRPMLRPAEARQMQVHPLGA